MIAALVEGLSVARGRIVAPETFGARRPPQLTPLQTQHQLHRSARVGAAAAAGGTVVLGVIAAFCAHLALRKGPADALSLFDPFCDGEGDPRGRAPPDAFAACVAASFAIAALELAACAVAHASLTTLSPLGAAAVARFGVASLCAAGANAAFAAAPWILPALVVRSRCGETRFFGGRPLTLGSWASLFAVLAAYHCAWALSCRKWASQLDGPHEADESRSRAVVVVEV